MKISIITACLNSESTIGDTISSVNSQDYSSIEHVFVDGGSSDDTVRIINSSSDISKVVVSEVDGGVYDALNKGVRLSTGDVIGFLHADDFLSHSGVLSAIASCFSDPQIGGVYGDLQYVRRLDSTRVFRRWETKAFNSRRLAWGWMPPHPTLYIRRGWYDFLGGFDTRYKISSDYAFVLKLFGSPDFKSNYIPEVLVKMRTGGLSNRSVKAIIQKTREDLRALKQFGVGGFPSLLAKNFRKLSQLL